MVEKGEIWYASGNDKWRGNNDLHKGPPAISKFREHWRVQERHEERKHLVCPVPTAKVRWRNATADEQAYQQAKRDGYYPVVHRAEAFQLESIPEEEEGFGSGKLGFRTDRRVAKYRRAMLTAGSQQFGEWLQQFPDLIGPLAAQSIRPP